MKLFILVISIMMLAVSKGNDDLLDKMLANVEECIKQSKVDPPLVDKLIKNTEFPNDDNLKCFIKCMYVSENIMTDGGTFDADKLRDLLDDDQNPDVVNRCKDLKGADNCDTAFVVAKCLEGM